MWRQGKPLTTTTASYASFELALFFACHVGKVLPLSHRIASQWTGTIIWNFKRIPVCSSLCKWACVEQWLCTRVMTLASPT